MAKTVNHWNTPLGDNDMKVRIVALTALVFVVLALPAAAQKAKGKVYKTPQEVFDTFVVALKKRDAVIFVGCLTPDSVKHLAGERALRALATRNRVEKSKDKDEQLKYKPMLDVLDKHGLTAKATKDIDPSAFQQRQKSISTLRDLIKDHAAFLTQILAADAKINPKDKNDDVTPKLTGVKTEGNKATATVVISVNGMDIKQPIEFHKVGDGWKIDPQPKPKAPAKDKDKKEKKKE